MTRDRVLALAQDAFDSLASSELIPQTISVTPDTVLIGAGSLLDSIAFVTFMIEMEERVRAEGGDRVLDFTIAVDELYDFNSGAELSVDTLIAFILRASSLM
jgi:hypothetical protein